MPQTPDSTATEAQFREFADSLPVVVWSAPAQGPARADYVNRQFLEIVGDTNPSKWRDLVHPDDRVRVVAEWERCHALGVPFQCEFRMAHGGTTNYRWYVGRAVPSRDQSAQVVRWYGTNTDIHEWKMAVTLVQAKRHILELIATGAPLQATLDAIVDLIELHWPDGVASIMLAKNGRLHVGSGRGLAPGYAEAISGLPIAEGVGSCGTAAFRGAPVIVTDIENSPLWANYLDLVRPHGLRACWSVPITGSHGDMLGTVAVYYRSAREPDTKETAFATESGASLAAIAIERDRNERELREQATVLAAADRHKDQFLANLAHEFRNPLGAIQAAVQVLQSRVDGDVTAGRPLRILERQSTHLVRLIEDLRDLSQIARGELQLQRQTVDVAATILEAVDIIRSHASARRQQVDLMLPPGSLELEGDPARLLQVFVNVLNNAIKYTHEGGRVTVSAEATPRELVIQVRDNGIGIAPDMLDEIFDLYVRTENAMRHANTGIGIGLHLVRTLVELHGGSVTAASGGVGQGSQFEIRLPIAGAPA